MDNCSKIIELNQKLMLRKFEIFYQENKKNPFDKEKLYKYMKQNPNLNFSIYVEYLLFIKNIINGKSN